ncbi:uncharacterized protein N7473_001626 [Penicillium subrubescens]|uniref:uncharacterized protein n=1 Tax=Penicillium subrubescens TaxID=1316194 RepID=UPI0025459F32|nr:uncharacterized protein N7473_001626 [Penicillium subrubescens]KAJ5904710.1 hypothetical protein N7473_001626 [Penicillium subrubescens]
MYRKEFLIVFFAITDSPLQTHLLFNFATIQAQAHTADTADSFAVLMNKDQTGTRSSRPFRRIHTPKVITGSPKTLCLSHLGRIDDVTSALLIRRESPWDTYRPVITYDGAGHVTIATRRSHPSRVVTIRQFPKEDTSRLIGRFGQLEHKTCSPCWDVTLMVIPSFFLSTIWPRVPDSASRLSFQATRNWLTYNQVLAGASYLSASGLTHPFLKCNDILLGLDGVVKIARLEECVDCTTSQAETTYIAAVPSIVMELMIPNTWDENACDTFSGPSSQSNVVQFLDATKGESSLIVLRQQPLVSGRYQAVRDLIGLARAAIHMSDVKDVPQIDCRK